MLYCPFREGLSKLSQAARCNSSFSAVSEAERESVFVVIESCSGLLGIQNSEEHRRFNRKVALWVRSETCGRLYLDKAKTCACPFFRVYYLGMSVFFFNRAASKVRQIAVELQKLQFKFSGF